MKQQQIEQLRKKIARTKESVELAEALAELAELLFYDDAVESLALFLRAFQISKAKQHRKGIGAYAEKLAIAYSRQDLAEQALEYAVIARDEYLSDGYSRGAGIAWRIIAEVHDLEGKFEEAEQDYAEAMRLHETAGDETSAAFTLSALAIHWWKRGEYAKSTECLLGARSMFRQQGNFSQERYVRHNLAVIESEIGNYSAALVQFLELADEREKSGDVVGLAGTLSNIGTNYTHIGDYENGLQYLLRALAIKEIHLPAKIDVDMSNVAFIYSKMGKLELAERYYRAALETSNKRGDRHESASYMVNLSGILSKAEKLDEAEAFALEAIEICRQLQTSKYMAGAYSNLAGVARKRGNSNEVLVYCYRAAAAAEKIGQNSALADCLHACASALLEVGRVEEAFEAALRCEQISDSASLQNHVAKNSELMAEIYEKKGDYKSALKYSRIQAVAREKELESFANQKLQVISIQFDVEQYRKDAELRLQQSNILQKEIEMKHKELQLLALHLVSKNEFLADLRDELSKNIANTDNVVQSVVERIQSTTKDDREWKRFEQHFLGTNPRFNAVLEEKSEFTLTQTELKVCSLIVSGLNTKEIASVLFVSPRTVETHRYRIHKKLRLGNLSLVKYLSSLE